MMEYLITFSVVFGAIGLRAFQQKVIHANQYPLMGIIGTCIYMAEGTAILLIARGGYLNILAGALGAGCGVVSAVMFYNRYFTEMFKKKNNVTVDE